MRLNLPPAPDGSRIELPKESRCLIIVGANGAGKTRFTQRLIADPANHAYPLSALRAIFDTRISEHTALDRILSTVNVPQDRSTQLDRLIALLMQDELINLLQFKIAHASAPDTTLPSTRLDRVMEAWREIFPDNHITVESGRMLFSSYGSESYSSATLSAGERTVIFYLSAVLYAPEKSVIFIDSPEMFLHPSIMSAVWNRVEMLRPDCSFVYTTHDLDFAASRNNATGLWVRSHDASADTWQISLLPSCTDLSSEVYLAIMGARKPVMFIEGDGIHSIDSKLYPLIFPDFTVHSLGSCNKVIEATRTFNSLESLHQMDSCGIVDRDRRAAEEVNYLRAKRIMVPDVAEIENILLLEEVIRIVARRRGKDPERVASHVKRAVISAFAHELKQQALMHTRHRVKHLVERRVDGRFSGITELERHIQGLTDLIKPRQIYDSLCREFRGYVEDGDYRGVLRVYNQKSMLPGSNVAGLCGFNNKDEYLAEILRILSTSSPDAELMRAAIRRCFDLNNDNLIITDNEDQSLD